MQLYVIHKKLRIFIIVKILHDHNDKAFVNNKTSWSRNCEIRNYRRREEVVLVQRRFANSRDIAENGGCRDKSDYLSESDCGPRECALALKAVTPSSYPVLCAYDCFYVHQNNV